VTTEDQVEISNDAVNIVQLTPQNIASYKSSKAAQHPNTPLAFVLATQFALHPQDVVYVVADPAAQWNAVIAALLPTVTAVRGVQVVGGGF